MAKKDGEEFDDDLDLSSFDDMGDFTKEGFDDFAMDEEKDRKPAKGFINSALYYGNKAKDGALEGLKQKIADEFPNADQFVSDVDSGISTVGDLKDEFVKGLTPELNQSKLLIRQLANRTRGILPDSIYKKILEKTEVEKKETEASVEKAREEGRNNSLNETLNSIFSKQMEAADANRKEEAVDKIYDRRISEMQHNASMGALADLRIQSHFQSTFLRTTLTAWMKKDLELKIRTMYLQEDSLIALKKQNEILVQKLDAIRHNTALPEVDKINLKERIQKQIYDVALQGMTNFFGNYSEQLKKKFKQNVLGPLKGTFSTLVENASMALDMSGFKINSFKDLFHLGMNAGVKFLGNQGAKIVGDKLDGLVPEDLKALIEASAEGGIDELKLMGSELASGQVPVKLQAILNKDNKFSKTSKSVLQTIAESMFPTIPTDIGGIRNSVYSDPDGAAKFTNKFTTTVEEIIPGYLRMQVRLLEAIANSDAVKANLRVTEEKFFDAKNREFVTSSVMGKRLNDRLYGTDEERATSLAVTANTITSAIADTKIDDAERQAYYNDQADIAVIINSLATAKSASVSSLGPEQVAWLIAFVNSRGNIAQALKKIDPAQQNFAETFFDYAFNKSGLNKTKSNEDLIRIANAIIGITGSNSGDIIGSAILQKIINKRMRGLMQEQDIYAQRFEKELNTQVGGFASSDLAKNYFARDKKTGERLYNSTGFVIDKDGVLSKIADARNNHQDIIEANLSLNNANNAHWNEETGDFEYDKKTGFAKVLDDAINDREDTLGGKVRNFFRETGETLLFRDDSVSDKIAQKMGFGKEYADFKNNVRSMSVDGMLKYFGTSKRELKRRISKIGKKTLYEGYRRVFNYMVNSKNGLLHDLARIMFRESHGLITLQKHSDIKDLAMMLSSKKYYNKMDMRALLHAIATQDTSTSLGQWSTLINIFLPEQLKAIGQMSDEDYERFINIDTIEARTHWLRRYLSKHINRDEANAQEEIEEAAVHADEQEEKMNGLGKQARKRARREAKDAARRAKFFSEQNIKTEESATEKKADEKDEAVKSSTGKAGGPDNTDNKDTDKKDTEKDDKSKTAFEKAEEKVKKAYNDSKEYVNKKFEETKSKYGETFDKKYEEAKTWAKNKYDSAKQQASETVEEGKGLFGRMVNRVKTATSKFFATLGRIAGLGGIRKILKDQLEVLNAILVAVSEKGAFGSGYGKVRAISEKLKLVKKGFFPTLGRVTGAVGNALWQTNVAGFKAAYNTLATSATILRHGLTNRICDVYIAPANVDDTKWPEPKEVNLKLSEKQFELGVYSDSKAKHRLKSVADIRGPVYDANGTELITKEDITRGLVDEDGKPISSWAARIGRMIYKSGGWTINTAVDLAVGTLRHIGPHALNLFRKSLSSPFRILESSFNRYFDVYRKDDMSRPLITARDQEDGRVVYTNGDKIKRTTEINSPVVWANMDPPQFAISDEDLKAGLVDAHGQPINSLSRKIGNIINWGGNLLGSGVSLFTKGYLSVFRWIFDKAKQGLRALFKKKYPYISVYLADDNNNWDPNNPVMKGIDIRNGKFCYEDGTIIKSAYGINKPVYRILDDGTMDLVVKADEVDHLVDIEGKRLTAFAGKSLIGKGIHAAWTVTKWGIKKTLRGAKRIIDLGRKGINFITKGMWDMLTDTTGLIYGGLKDILGTVFHGDTLLNRKDLETIVGERLEKIYKLLDYRLPGKPMASDKDGDGDRDNSYEDQKQKSDERKKKYEDTKKAKEQAKQEKKDKEDAKKAAAAGAGDDSGDDGSSLSETLMNIFMGKSILDSFKGSKTGRRLGGIATLLGKATRGLGKTASYITRGKVGATLAEKGALKTTGEMFNSMKGKVGGFFGKGGAGSAAASKLANTKFGQKIVGKRMANIMAKRGLASATRIGARIAVGAAARGASYFIPIVGQVLAIATVAALTSNALGWAAGKIRDAMFGSKNEHELLDIRRKGYGTDKKQDSIIEDLEEDVIDAFDLRRDPLTDDELEDYAERFGILSTPAHYEADLEREKLHTIKIAKRRAYIEAKAAAKRDAKATGKAPAKIKRPKKPELDQATIDELMPDTKAQRQEFFNAWLVGRAQEVIKAYYGVVRWFTQTKQGDSFDPDDIPEHVRNQAAETLYRAIKQLLTKNNITQLELTEKGYQKWRSLYAGKIKHQKDQDGTDGRTPEEVSRLYGGAASVKSSEEKTASGWNTYRKIVKGDGLREWAAKRSWWNPLKYGAYIVGAVGWTFDFLVNGTVDLVMDSAIGDWLKSINTAYNKGGGILGAIGHLFDESRTEKEQTWFEARMHQYGWEEVGSDVFYETEKAITDLEKEEFKLMVGERKPIEDDELKEFGGKIGFLEKESSFWSDGFERMAKAAVMTLSPTNGLFFYFGTNQKGKTKEVLMASSKAIADMTKGIEDKELLKKIAEIDSQETRFKYLKAWYIGRFTPSYAAYADVVVKAGEQEIGEEPDPNKIHEFRMEEALEAFLRNAAQHCNRDALQLCPNEQTYRIWIEAQVKELVDKYKADLRKAEIEKKLATSPNEVAKQEAIPVVINENKDDENKNDASTSSEESNEKEDAKETETEKTIDLSKLNSPNTVPKEDEEDKLKLKDGVKGAYVNLYDYLHPGRLLAGWWHKFLGRDEQSSKLELERFDAYGFDDKHVPNARDALLELEKKNYPVIEKNEGAGIFDDKFLEDFAVDIGFQMSITRRLISSVTNFFTDIFRGSAGRKDAWEARQTESDMRREYIRNWFDSRFYPILASYYNIMKAHNATDVNMFGKIKVVPDKMTPEEFDKAFKEFKSAIDKILANKEVKDLIPTEEGFKAFAEARLKATKQAKHKGKSIDDRLLDEIKDEKELINQRKKDDEQSDKLKNAVDEARENTRKEENKKEESKGWFSDLTAKTKSGLTSITDWMGLTDSTAEGIQVPKPKQVNPTETSQHIWKFFKSKGWTDEGVAALMGNLEKESTMRPVQLQGDLSDQKRTRSMRYAEEADKNKRNFIGDYQGFGLAQWTTPDRKENLWNYAQSNGKSVGDLDTQLDFLYDELTTKYKGVVKDLKNSKDLAASAVNVLKKFEVARDRNLKSEQEDRASMAMGWFNTYAGKELESESSTDTAPSTTPLSSAMDSIGTTENSTSAPGGVLTSDGNGSISTSSPMAAGGASDASTDNSNQQAAQTATAAFEKTGIVPDSDSSTDYTNKGETNTVSSSESTAELKKVVNIKPGVDVDNEHPLLKTRFAEMAKEFKEKFGRVPTITGGKRSLAHQEALYRRLGPEKAAKPQPYAPHIAGLALDASSDDMTLADLSGLLAKHGLWRPLKNWRRTKEPWHVEVMGSRDPQLGVITKETLDKINQQSGGTASPSAGSDDGGAITTATGQSIPQTDSDKVSPGSVASNESSSNMETSTPSTSTPSLASSPTPTVSDVNVANPGASASAATSSMEQPNPMVESFNNDEKSTAQVTEANNSEDLKGIQQELTRISSLLESYLEENKKGVDSMVQIASNMSASDKVKATSGSGSISGDEIASAIAVAMGPGSDFAKMLQSLTGGDANMNRKGLNPPYAQSGFNPMSPISVSRSI